MNDDMLGMNLSDFLPSISLHGDKVSSVSSWWSIFDYLLFL